LLQSPQGHIRDWIQRAARQCWGWQFKPAGLTGTAKNSFAPLAYSSPWTTPAEQAAVRLGRLFSPKLPNCDVARDYWHETKTEHGYEE
jgi:hypothetical protein